jgi:type IV pilus assembly protein PilN
MMISVNLRPGTKRRKSGPSFGFSLDRLKGLGSMVKDPLRLVAILAWVGAVGFLGFMYVSTGARLSSLEPKLEETRSEHRRFQDFLAQKHREEQTRDSILAQIRTIRQVDGDRYVWPHILNEVAQAVPPFTWLVNVTFVAPPAVPLSAKDSVPADTVPPPVKLQVTGRTVDIQGYTRFMRQLEDSPWLDNVTAISASTVVEKGRAVTAFILTATFSRPPEDHIQSVPVTESVVR